MSDVTTDFLIVGSGLIGALVARQLREQLPTARIEMVDGAPLLGSVPGQHLHDTPEDEIREQYNQKAAIGVQSVYVGPSFPGDAGRDPAALAPGMVKLDAFGEDLEQMPSAAAAWNVGGMGVHWTAACPWPFADEIVPFLPRKEWDADLETARDRLGVANDPFPASAAGRIAAERMAKPFAEVSAPGRQLQPMPMAITRTDGAYARTGPNRIFSALSDESDDFFTLRAGTLCVEVLHRDGIASGARMRRITDGTEFIVEARAVIVCADPLRTPQLLWASGIRGEAVGAYLNEHAFLSGRVTVDEEKLGIRPEQRPVFDPDEPFSGSYWLPYSGVAQPVHVQIMEFLNRAAEDTDETILSIGASVYVPTEVRRENRIVFLDDSEDTLGLPLMRIEFDYSDHDRERIAEGAHTQALLCGQVGHFDTERDSLLLPAGSSMHYTGTVRMGQLDDGTSVCDTDARVWGFGNIFVAGGGVVPTALSCNSTLTAAVLAVRTARAAARLVDALAG